MNLCSGLDEEFGCSGSQGSQGIDRIFEAFRLLDLFTYLALVHKWLVCILKSFILSPKHQQPRQHLSITTDKESR